MDDKGAFIARVVQADGRWRGYLTATSHQVPGDHPTHSEAMVAVDDHLAGRPPRRMPSAPQPSAPQPSAPQPPADIHQDIKTLRGIDHGGPCRYQQLLHWGVGRGAELGRSLRRLEKAGYVDVDDRWIGATAEGRAALRRLDDPAAKNRLLAELFYEQGISPEA
jgi:hypothetical protein